MFRLFRRSTPVSGVGFSVSLKRSCEAETASPTPETGVLPRSPWASESLAVCLRLPTVRGARSAILHHSNIPTLHCSSHERFLSFGHPRHC
jgi:hypothetical protein